MSRSNKHKQSPNNELPAIPDKRYFTISEVSHLCVVKAYVLRYWEQEFSQLKPVKRRGRRCYQQQDILLVRLIKKLLYEDGYTIDGARTQLVTVLESINQSAKTNIFVKKIISDLEGILQYLKKDVVIN